MTTSPHNQHRVAANFLAAVKAVAAEQRCRPRNPPASNDALLARRHAMRPRHVSVAAKLMSSFDLPANRGSDHHADNGSEYDAHSSDDISSAPPRRFLSDPASASSSADQRSSAEVSCAAMSSEKPE